MGAGYWVMGTGSWVPGSIRARGEAEALRVVARHRHLDHLDRAAGEAEGHPHQRAGARPSDQIVGGNAEEALVGEFVVDTGDIGVVHAL